MRLLITAWIAGELFSLFLDQTDVPWDLILPFVISGLVYLPCHMSKDFQLKLIFFYVLGTCCIASAGFYWVEYLRADKPQQKLSAQFEGRSIIIQGFIDELPRVSEKSVQFGFQVTHWKAPYSKYKQELTDDFPKRISLLYPSKDFLQAFKPGQYLELKVKLKQIHGLKNPHGFDVEEWMYIQNYDAQGVIQKDGARLLDSTHQDFRTTFELLRFYIRQKIQNSLGPDARYAGVIAALVIGDQQMIHPDDWKVFAQTGIGHLISISGLHVTMLAGFGAWISLLLVKRTRMIYWQPAQYIASCIGFLTAFMYTWLAGFQIPAQRTTFMVGIAAFGMYLGRRLHAMDIWFWALFLVLTCNPWAVYSPGFWLSFGAVIAMIFAMPKNQQEVIDIDLLFIEKLKNSFGEAARVQAVVTIALIPLTLYWFYQISLISPIANAIAIPVVSFLVTPFAMLGAFLPWFLGDVFLWIAHSIFSLLMILIRPLGQWEWSSITGAKPTGWHLLLSLIGVIICIRPGILIESWKSRMLGLITCLTLFIPKEYLPGRIPYGEVEMTVWDIGQGNAVLIQTQSHSLLFDTGPISFGKFDPGEKIIIPHLKAEGIRKIDQLVISHQDADHIGGLRYLLENFPIQNAMGSISPDHQVQQYFSKNKVFLEKCQAGQSWHWDGIDFYVWHPELEQDAKSQYKSTKPNDMSCVIEVRNSHHSIWLTGDVEKNAERLIVERLIEDQTQLQEIQTRNLILMAPHHGSKSSSTPMFLDLLDPESAFSQTGYKNRYQHPHPDIVKRYQDGEINLLDTVNTGAQIWRSEGNQLKIHKFRNETSTP
jgi:competence protein ComEC